jgi:hypothetical protein
MPEAQDIDLTNDGLRLYALLPALIDCPPGLYQHNPTDINPEIACIRFCF